MQRRETEQMRAFYDIEADWWDLYCHLRDAHGTVPPSGEPTFVPELRKFHRLVHDSWERSLLGQAEELSRALHEVGWLLVWAGCDLLSRVPGLRFLRRYGERADAEAKRWKGGSAT